MDILQWSIDPWGHSVPIHIAWFLIQVAFFAAVAFLIVHAAYVRFFAGEKQWSGTTAPEVAAAGTKVTVTDPAGKSADGEIHLKAPYDSGMLRLKG